MKSQGEKAGARKYGYTLFRYALLSITVVLATASLAAFAVPGLRWRARLTILTAAGRIPDFALTDLVAFLSPGSNQSLERLVGTRNPYSVIRNPKSAASDIAAGDSLFESNCASCHGFDATGGRGPSLVGREFRHGTSDWAVFRTIMYGIPDTMMAPARLARNQIWQVAAFLRALDPENNVKAPGRSAPSVAPVSAKELQSVTEASSEWLTFSGSYSSARHSSLTQIDPENIDRLRVRWLFQYPGPTTTVETETSPIVRSGVMFITWPGPEVMALDAATGTLIWRYQPPRPKDVVVVHNRGVAILGDKVFVGTSDSRLIALSAATGQVVWQTAVADYKDGYSISAAPLAYKDMVVTGVATSSGGRAFVAAYDAATGKERWRFLTVPGPGEPGNNTWSGDSWRNGGAPTWTTGSYDPALDLLYWTAGNPKPDFDPAVRKGDNLYSDSVIALRGSTGQLVWHFQFTPQDERDWDANQMPVLVDRAGKKGTQRLLLLANRNAFYYVLDRESGRFISATAFARQNWADGIDANGRPILHKEQSATYKGVLIYPGSATNWWPPSFDPKRDLLFVPTLEAGRVFFPNETSGSNPDFAAFSYPSDRDRTFYTAVRALDSSTGNLVWEYRLAPRYENGNISGVLSTGSGLVFAGDQATFFALSAKTGGLLWSFGAGGTIVAPPVTYMANGEQLVTVAAGTVLVTFGLPENRR